MTQDTAAAGGAPGIADILAGTPLQEGLLALHRTGEGSDPYHIQCVFRMDGPLDADLLRRSVVAAVDRHPNLRAAFVDRGVPHPVQVIPVSAPLDWEVVDAVPGAADPAVAAAEFRRPFDLSAPSPMRFRLLRRSATRHELIFTAHHIIIDGWSAPLFFREVMEIYEADGDASHLPAPAPYRAYIAWLAERSRDRSLARWRERLGEGTTPCHLSAAAASGDAASGDSTDRTGSTDRTPGPGHATVEAALGTAATRVLTDWCRAHRVTVSTATLFAWAVVLGVLTDRDDVVTGTVVSGRPPEVPGIGSMVGMFINTVPVRVRLRPGDDAASQVEALHRDVTEMREHEYVGLADIQRQAGQRDLFDTLVVYQNTPGGDDGVRTTSQGVRVTPLRTADSTHYPFTLVPAVVDGRLTVRGEYREDDAGRTGLPVRPERIVRAVTALLETLPLSDGTALARLGTGFGAGDGDGDGGDGDGGAGGGRTGATSPDATSPDATSPDAGTVTPVHGRLAALVAADPDAPAVCDGSTVLTRAGLWDRAGRVAARLRALGVRQGDRVGLSLPRGVGAVAGIVGCLRAGAVIVHTDVTAPADHRRGVLARAGVRAVLTGADAPDTTAVVADAGAGAPAAAPGDGVPEGAERVVVTPDGTLPPTATAPRTPPTPGDARPRTPDEPAYVIFTSGSTGAPKGVVGTHRGLAALVDAHRRLVLDRHSARLGRQLVVGHAWSLAFDASWQPLAALFAGHVVAVLDDAEMRDPRLYRAALARHRVDVIETSPTMLGQLERQGPGAGGDAGADLNPDPDAPAPWPGLEVLGLGGEAVDPAVWSRLAAAARPEAYNFYGPTETTVDAVSARLRDHPAPVIGHPLPGTAVMVLDRWLRPVPDGLPGELYITGPQVTQGYTGREDAARLTAAAFVAAPGGARAYRTGDIVVRRAGALAYLGRADDQVKVRGFRVEPAEVLAAVRSLEGVDDARVGVHRGPGGPRLVAAVVPRSAADREDPAGAAARWTAHLRGRVAAHLVPSAVVPVDGFPLTRNGKLDTAELTARAAALRGAGAAGASAAPDGPVERELADALGALTGTPVTDRDEDIRDLGVDSILLMQLCSDLVERGGPLARVTPRLVLAAPTVRGIAGTLASLDTAGGDAAGSGTGASGTTTPAPARPADAGDIPVTPVQEWLLRGGGWRRFCQWAPVTVPSGLTAADLRDRLGTLAADHGLLRATVLGASRGPVPGEGGRGAAGSRRRPRITVPALPDDPTDRADWIRAVGDAVLVTHPGHGGRPTPQVLGAVARQVIETVDPNSGHMLRAAWFPGDDGTGGLVVLVAHHLAVDGMSWRVILDDLARGTSLPETTPFRRWAGFIDDERSRRAGAPADPGRAGGGADAGGPEAAQGHPVDGGPAGAWERYLATGDRSALGSRRVDPAVDRAADAHADTTVASPEETSALLDIAASAGRAGTDAGERAERAGLREVLLAVLAGAVARWRGTRRLVVDLEGHGRDDDVLTRHGTVADDLSRTVGWFTTVTPLVLPDPAGPDPTGAAPAGPPGHGSDPGEPGIIDRAREVARELTRRPGTPVEHSVDCGVCGHGVEVEVNYLGRLDMGAGSGGDTPADRRAAPAGEAPASGAWTVVTDEAVLEALPEMPEPDLPRTYAVEATFSVAPSPDGPRVTARFNLAAAVFGADDLAALTSAWRGELGRVVGEHRPR